MTNPFGCGPSPCEWTCREVVVPFECSIFSYNLPGLSLYTQVVGIWSTTATSMFSLDANAVALANVPAPEPNTYNYVQLDPGNLVANTDAYIYSNSSLDHSSFMYGRLQIAADNLTAILSIGTDAGQVNSVVIDPWLNTQGLVLCYFNGNLTVNLVNTVGSTSAAVADNGHRYVGFGQGATSVVQFFVNNLSYHGDVGRENCPECYGAIALAAAPVEMRRGKPIVAKGKRRRG